MSLVYSNNIRVPVLLPCRGDINSVPKATGIFIKTYKDREKQKEEERDNPSTPSIDSTVVGSYGAVDMYGPGIGDNSNNVSNTSESKKGF